MKRVIYIMTLAVLVTACAGKVKDVKFEEALKSNNIASLKNTKKSLEIKSQELLTKLDKLNAKIFKLEPNKKQPLVTVKKIEIEVFKHYFELQGDVKAKKNLILYPQAPAQLTRVLVQKGQRVSRGQVLALLDDNGLSNQLESLRIQSELAKTTYERQKNLWSQKIGSEIQFLQAKAQYEASVKGISQMEGNMTRYKILAPFSGVIDDVFKEKGALVAPGRGGEVFRIVNLGNMHIEADVPEKHLANIKKGKEVIVEYKVLGKTINSKIKQVGSFINPKNRTFKIEVKTPSFKGAIKPNMSARLKINDYQNNKAILVSQGVISEKGNGDKYVYLLTDENGNKGVVKKVIIETGKSIDGKVEVLSGLSVNDVLIVEGARSVKEGQEVIVLQ